MKKFIRCIVCLIFMLFATSTTCFANPVYVGQDDTYTDIYFLPNSIEILSREKEKVIFTVMVEEILSQQARNESMLSSYDRDLCQPYSPSIATRRVLQYRYKMTPKKLEYRQELYVLMYGDMNVLGIDTVTKYYHDCKSPLVTFMIFQSVSKYIVDNKL